MKPSLEGITITDNTFSTDSCWCCPLCNQTGGDIDKRLVHLVQIHNVKIDLLKLADALPSTIDKERKQY